MTSEESLQEAVTVTRLGEAFELLLRGEARPTHVFMADGWHVFKEDEWQVVSPNPTTADDSSDE